MSKPNDYKIYLFSVKWYSEYDESFNTSYGLTMAPSYGDAMDSIVNRFHDCEEVAISECIEDVQFLFFGKQTYETLKEDIGALEGE